MAFLKSLALAFSAARVGRRGPDQLTSQPVSDENNKQESGTFLNEKPTLRNSIVGVLVHKYPVNMNVYAIFT